MPQRYARTSTAPVLDGVQHGAACGFASIHCTCTDYYSTIISSTYEHIAPYQHTMTEVCFQGRYHNPRTPCSVRASHSVQAVPAGFLLPWACPGLACDRAPSPLRWHNYALRGRYRWPPRFLRLHSGVISPLFDADRDPLDHRGARAAWWCLRVVVPWSCRSCVCGS